VEQFSFGKAVLGLSTDKVVPQNLPPVLAETIPQLPFPQKEEAGALLCSGFTCHGPISEPEELSRCLREAAGDKQLRQTKKG